MKSDVAPSLSNAAAAAAADVVEQRRAAIAQLPDACPSHAHEHDHAPAGEALLALPSTLRHPSSATTSPKLWRSRAELENSPEFMELLEREFPKAASEWTDELSRRHFMKIMGASLALAGAAGCWKRPDGKVVPYVVPPEQVVPGRPLFFATTYTMEGVGRGVLVESHEGRPTKIEGNPDHPASRGASSAHMQASILSMYDPERSQAPLRTGDSQSWDRFVSEILPKLEAQRGKRGTGLRVLMTPCASPTAERQLELLKQQYPDAKLHTYDPAGHMTESAGAQAAFGQVVNTVYQIDKAKVVLSLDSNFLYDGGGSLRYAKDFINGRRVREDHHKPEEMNRLYVVESTPTITGAMADHKLRVKPSAVEAFARALLAQINGDKAAGSEFAWLSAAAADLLANRGTSVVLAGDYQSPVLQALAHQINAALGNVGQTLYYTDPVYSKVATGTLAELVTDANAGAVELLFILGGNPVYDAPADLNVVAALEKVAYKVRLGTYNDETSFQCHWHIPESHFLEMWSDSRAFDGTASLVQPLIAPLYDSKSVHSMLAVITDQRDRSDYQLVRDTWTGVAKLPAPEFETWWREALNRGVIPNTALAPKQVAAAANVSPAAAASGGGVEIVFRPDPNVLDGRFSNNGWLQELPKPLTKLTWDNVVFISPKKADELGIPQTDKWDDAWGYHVNVTANGKELKNVPTWVVPGHPDDAVTLFLGYGRSRAGLVADNVGFDVNPLRTVASPWFATDATIVLGEGRLRLACTQLHQLMKGSSARDLIRVHTIADYENAKHGPHGSQAGHGGGHGDDHKNYSGEDAAHGSDHGKDAAGNVSAAAPMPADDNHPKTDDHAKDMATGESAFDKKYKNVPLTLYTQKHPSDPPYDPATNQWAMSIDNNACIGCNACVVACQSENNIPIVGKQEVIFGREMHWLRIDTYFGGDSVNDVEGPYFQPLPCMHCEAAPCEVVCPVAATQHDGEGLNVMTYNRCVGTKYCSNNCPYKVRRFNFFRYKDDTNESIALMRNPNVSIRTRGVMEKCTFCIQRISAARIEAKKHGGADGGPSEGKVVTEDVPMTACQQSCPTDAIIFGSLTNRDSNLVKLKTEPTDYALLAELNTRPRVTYMGRFTNPNPAVGNG